MNKFNRKNLHSKLKGVKIFTESNFKDKRGILWTSWNKLKLNKINFNHDKFSLSKKNVFRGLHYDNKTWKLISCAYRKIFLVIVNLDKKSSQYMKSQTFTLSHNENIQILIPPKFANGHYCLSRECLFHYKLFYKGSYNDVKNQKNIKWSDKRLNIKWPFKKPILSQRDR